MKSTGVMHGELSGIIARMGHGDKLVIADNGLPIPQGVSMIDLALAPGKVSFLDALQAVCEELVIESYLAATELQEGNPALLQEVDRAIQTKSELVSHADFKKACSDAVAVVRTGERTPYANVILIAGVPF